MKALIAQSLAQFAAWSRLRCRACLPARPRNRPDRRTTVTDSVILAALRSIEGPPMSICSMASSSVARRLRDGRLEGDRDSPPRDRSGSMPWASRLGARAPGLSRR